MKYEEYLNVAQIIVSITLVLIVLMQARGGGGFGTGASSIVRTRRGVEKTLFQLTIVLVIIFLFISALSVTAAR
ncbi:MAG: preprotein translocase subunit SecG [Chloroflexota bacterium]|nr:preprotein translocase subunit SecG [Chloroflexota bacterium]